MHSLQVQTSGAHAAAALHHHAPHATQSHPQASSSPNPLPPPRCLQVKEEDVARARNQLKASSLYYSVRASSRCAVLRCVLHVLANLVAQ